MYYVSTSVLFDFWLKTLYLEILSLLYVRAISAGNFQLCVESLTKVVPWILSLVRTLYSRWLPVHIRDKMLLSRKHLNVLVKFRAGKFIVHNDQCHGQKNAIIKGSGGAVGLTDNPPAIRRWIVAGPELARMIAELEDDTTRSHQKDSVHHHLEQHLVSRSPSNICERCHVAISTG